MFKWFKLGVLMLALSGGTVSIAVPLIEEGEVSVTVQQFRAALNRLSPAERADVLRDPDSVRFFANQLLVERKMLHEAEAQGLHETPRVVEQLALMRQRLLLETLIENHLRQQPPPELDALAEEYYLASPSAFRDPEQIRVAQIFLPVTDPEQRDEIRNQAEALHRQLQEGADFAKLARAHSADPHAAEGGKIPEWQVRGNREHPVLEAAFALPEVGAISAVLEEDAGFRILTLLERRDSQLRPFEEVKDRLLPRLRSQYQRQQRETYINSFAPSDEAIIHEHLLRGLSR